MMKGGLSHEVVGLEVTRVLCEITEVHDFSVSPEMIASAELAPEGKVIHDSSASSKDFLVPVVTMERKAYLGMFLNSLASPVVTVAVVY